MNQYKEKKVKRCFIFFFLSILLQRNIQKQTSRIKVKSVFELLSIYVSDLERLKFWSVSEI